MQSLLSLLARAIDVDPNAVGIPTTQLNQSQVTSVFNGVLAIAGAVAVIFIVLGGIKYSTSQGNPADTQKAKDTIVYALVGLVFVILSFAIVQLFSGRVF